MRLDWVSNPVPLALELDALLTALHGLAVESLIHLLGMGLLNMIVLVLLYVYLLILPRETISKTSYIPFDSATFPEILRLGVNTASCIHNPSPKGLF